MVLYTTLLLVVSTTCDETLPGWSYCRVVLFGAFVCQYQRSCLYCWENTGNWKKQHVHVIRTYLITSKHYMNGFVQGHPCALLKPFHISNPQSSSRCCCNASARRAPTRYGDLEVVHDIGATGDNFIMVGWSTKPPQPNTPPRNKGFLTRIY